MLPGAPEEFHDVVPGRDVIVHQFGQSALRPAGDQHPGGAGRPQAGDHLGADSA